MLCVPWHEAACSVAGAAVACTLGRAAALLASRLNIHAHYFKFSSYIQFY